MYKLEKRTALSRIDESGNSDLDKLINTPVIYKYAHEDR